MAQCWITFLADLALCGYVLWLWMWPSPDDLPGILFFDNAFIPECLFLMCTFLVAAARRLGRGLAIFCLLSYPIIFYCLPLWEYDARVVWLYCAAVLCRAVGPMLFSSGAEARAWDRSVTVRIGVFGVAGALMVVLHETGGLFRGGLQPGFLESIGFYAVADHPSMGPHIWVATFFLYYLGMAFFSLWASLAGPPEDKLGLMGGL